MMEKEINTQIFIDALNSGNEITVGSKIHQYMVRLSNEAMKITSRLNREYHEPEEIRKLFSELIGSKVDDSFGMFPPFYTDCGKNIHVGKNVFINSGCHFQDQGASCIIKNVDVEN